MKTNPNTTNARILPGARFEGDDTFWITENGCEDIGPFDTRELAEEFYAEFVGPTGSGDKLTVNGDLKATKIVNFRDGEPDLGHDDNGQPLTRDGYIDGTCDATGLLSSVVAEYLDAGYMIVNG